MKIAKNGTFFIYANKWCPRREFDASKLFGYLVANHLIPVDDPGKADLTIIYGCGAFNWSEEKSILTIEKALKNKSKLTILTGCLPEIDPKKLEKYVPPLTVLPTEELGKLDSLLDAEVYWCEWQGNLQSYPFHDLYGGNPLYRVKNFLKQNPASPLRSLVNALRCRLANQVFAPTTYKIEIAKGCVGDCSFCVIRYGTKFRSFPAEQVIKRFRLGLKKKYHTFALIAGDLGCYGFDTGSSLPKLLEELLKVEGDYKIILVDLNARWFVEYFPQLLSVLKAHPQKVTRIIIPVQSGSNRILKLMKRHYEIETVEKRIKELRKVLPKIVLETHIMVGFPGETEEDFEESLKFIRTTGFSNVQVYRYEDRPSSESSKMSSKVSQSVISERVKRMGKELSSRDKFC